MAKRDKITQVKYIPTKILQEILNSAPYYVTSEGTEYHNQVDEIREVLAVREDRKMDRVIHELTDQEAIQAKYEAQNKGLKYCPKCNLLKSHSDYYKRSSKSNKLRSICKACMRLQDIPF